MNSHSLHSLAFALLISLAGGCTIPQIIKPLNIYNIKDGTTLQLLFNPTSPEHGTISSSTNTSQHFHGECSFSSDRRYPRPNSTGIFSGKSDVENVPAPKDFAEAYGFSKDVPAKPVGTGIIIDNNGTVIELVFYHCSYDLRSNDIHSADGIGRDNNGNYYRVFMSTQSQ